METIEKQEITTHLSIRHGFTKEGSQKMYKNETAGPL